MEQLFFGEQEPYDLHLADDNRAFHKLLCLKRYIQQRCQFRIHQHTEFRTKHSTVRKTETNGHAKQANPMNLT